MSLECSYYTIHELFVFETTPYKKVPVSRDLVFIISFAVFVGFQNFLHHGQCVATDIVYDNHNDQICANVYNIFRVTTGII